MDEPWKRFAAVAVAVVAIIVAFTVLQPDEQAADRGDQPGQTGETTQETDDGEAVGGSQPLLGGTRNEPGAESEPEPVALEFADGEVVGGVETIEVTSGEEVTLTVTSDVQEELHIHGVDLYEDLPPGEEVEVTFTPEAEGVFELELHDSATQIASMEVSPS